jgi:predicted dehydrogenase
MTDAVDVGIFGVGNIGTVHLQTALACDDVADVLVADIVDENRERALALGADRAYEAYEDLLATGDPDVVVVALPPFLHAEATIAAVESGCHAFVEKPFARDPGEAEAMLSAADRAGVSLGVDHTSRYRPEVRRVKERYDKGAIGHVPTCSIWRFNNGPFSAPPAGEPPANWQLDPEATGGGALLDLGVHLFDVLEWFFGDPSVEHATLDRTLALPYEDAATVVVSTESGTTATLSCGFFQWEDPPNVTGGMRLDGVADSLSSEEFMPSNFVSHAARSALENVGRRARGRAPEVFKPTYFYQAHYRALTAFIAAVSAGREPPVTGADGARAIELVTEAYRLAEGVEEPIEVTR